MSATPRVRRRAFTLLELIVVLAVFGVIAALTIPTYVRTINAADDSTAQYTLVALSREARVLAVFDNATAFTFEHFDAALGDLNAGPAAAAGIWADGQQWEWVEHSTVIGEISLGMTAARDQASLAMRTRTGACTATHLHTNGTLLSWTSASDDCSAEWVLVSSGAAEAGTVVGPDPTGDVDLSPVGTDPDPAPETTTTTAPETTTTTVPSTTTTAPPTTTTTVPGVPGYGFDGWFAPVHNTPMVNAANAGQAIPMKFSLGGFFGYDIFVDDSPWAQQIDCENVNPLSDVVVAETPGASGLSYNPGNDRYQWVWDTDRDWRGERRRLVMDFDDGTSARAYFQFKNNGRD